MARGDLSDLEVLATVAGHRSFRRAAAELGVSASALSHAVSGLEERMGVRLLNRTTRSVAPTEAGERLIARLAPAFSEIRSAIADARSSMGRPAGALRLTVPTSAAQLLLGPLLARFLQAFPEIEMEVSADNSLIDAVAAGFDAGIRFGERLQQDMVAVRIGPDQRMLVVGAPAYLARRGTPERPHDLAGHNCLRQRLPSGGIYRWELEKEGEPTEFEPAGSFTTNDHIVLKRMAVDGFGLTFMFEGHVADEIRDGRLVPVLEDWCPAFPGFFLYYPSRRHMPATLRAFIDFLKAEVF
ncbi:DNA-binding transcriptional regulator, LysR family [Faunimonas pinastri]|uniref:DNA-binding transcriptional regulator, LysR family n=1 Tax=Faunimonas pinastri TaxID=1855383 RepID=A0A1H9NNB9_9HYPH|nr:LysR family transcriptional regulator [Faunimonas pinastri]SER36873.1 DNA-binding transcriptional regulator, LysR family [Faunimonas pinastri]